jgi:hypothetical protein
MQVSELLRQRVTMNIKKWVEKVSTFKIVFTLSSSGYCAIHWLATHNLSIYVFSAALLFGAAVATAVAWLWKFVQASRARWGG